MKNAPTFALLTAIAALPLASCAPGEPLAALNPMVMGTDLTPEAAPAYVAMAASGDMYEIQSSRMALQRSRDARHRQFAQMMIRDHTNTTARLIAAARSVGLVPPPGMLPLHAQMLNQLAASRNFDATYRQQQLTAHQMALNLHANYAARGDRQPLRAVASMATPAVRMHLQYLQRL
jgi:putative membrane protein